MADGITIPAVVEEPKLEIHKYKNKKVRVGAVMFYGAIVGETSDNIEQPTQQASGYRLDIFDIEELK